MQRVKHFVNTVPDHFGIIILNIRILIFNKVLWIDSFCQQIYISISEQYMIMTVTDTYLINTTYGI
jgi:hypothetical protein